MGRPNSAAAAQLQAVARVAAQLQQLGLVNQKLVPAGGWEPYYGMSAEQFAAVPGQPHGYPEGWGESAGLPGHVPGRVPVHVPGHAPPRKQQAAPHAAAGGGEVLDPSTETRAARPRGKRGGRKRRTQKEQTPPALEKRIDPTDGRRYTQDEFLLRHAIGADFSKGDRLWEEAVKVPPAAVKPAKKPRTHAARTAVAAAVAAASAVTTPPAVARRVQFSREPASVAAAQPTEDEAPHPHSALTKPVRSILKARSCIRPIPPPFTECSPDSP